MRVEDVGRQTSGSQRHVLAAVEDEQRRARFEVLEDRRTIVSFSPGHTEGVGHRGGDQSSVRRLRQVGDPDSVGPRIGDAQPELDREPGLAHAAGSDDREQSSGRDPARELGERVLAPDERRRGSHEVVTLRGHRAHGDGLRERRIVARHGVEHDRLIEVAESERADALRGHV